MLNFKTLLNQTISSTPGKFIDPSHLEHLKQYLNSGQKLIKLCEKINKNEASLVSFLVQKAMPIESDINLKKAYQENFSFLLQCLEYSIISGEKEVIIEPLRDQILTHLVPEIMLSTLDIFISFAHTSFLENDYFSQKDNEILAKYIESFNTLLKQIRDHQKDLQEKLLRWFDEVEQIEILPPETSTPYQQSLIDKYRAKGLTL
jgi:hypothetical protein